MKDEILKNYDVRPGEKLTEEVMKFEFQDPYLFGLISLS